MSHTCGTGLARNCLSILICGLASVSPRSFSTAFVDQALDRSHRSVVNTYRTLGAIGGCASHFIISKNNNAPRTTVNHERRKQKQRRKYQANKWCCRCRSVWIHSEALPDGKRSPRWSDIGECHFFSSTKNKGRLNAYAEFRKHPFCIDFHRSKLIVEKFNAMDCVGKFFMFCKHHCLFVETLLAFVLRFASRLVERVKPQGSLNIGTIISQSLVTPDEKFCVVFMAMIFVRCQAFLVDRSAFSR